MKFGNPIEEAKKEWNDNIGDKIPFLTFLVAKKAGVNKKRYVTLGDKQFEEFKESFLMIDGNLDLPYNDSIKNPTDYHKTLHQHIYKKGYPYPDAFEKDPTVTEAKWKFTDQYIELTKKHGLLGKKIKIRFVLIYLYYKNVEGNYADIRFIGNLYKRFKTEFNILPDEEKELFERDFDFVYSEFDKLNKEKNNNNKTSEIKPENTDNKKQEGSI